MGRRKFTDYELGELIREGKSPAEIAEKLGVTPRAVYKRAALLKVNAGKEALMSQAEGIIRQDINAAEQLLEINQSTMDLLTTLIEIVRSEGNEQKEKLAKIEYLLGDKTSLLDALVKLKREHREQLRLVMDIWKARFDMVELKAVQDLIIEAVGEEAPECRGRIVKRIRERGSLRFGMPWMLAP